MPAIDLLDITVDFPVYSARGRSLRGDILRKVGGQVSYRGTGDEVTVQSLNRLSLRLRSGDRLGLIGTNGAGKSTLLRVLAGVYEPVEGDVIIEGKVTSLLDVGLGIDPEMTGYENILLRSALLGLTFAEARANIASIAAFTELGPFLDLPVRAYSAGMTLRLAFAVCTSHRPDIVLLDETMRIGDAAFEEKAHRRLNALLGDDSILVMATHDQAMLRAFCNKVAWMQGGMILEIGAPDEILARYGSERAPDGGTRGAHLRRVS